MNRTRIRPRPLADVEWLSTGSEQPSSFPALAGADDFVARTDDGYTLRVEQMDKRAWWWQVSTPGDHVLNPHSVCTTTKEAAFQFAELVYMAHARGMRDAKLIGLENGEPIRMKVEGVAGSEPPAGPGVHPGPRAGAVSASQDAAAVPNAEGEVDAYMELSCIATWCEQKFGPIKPVRLVDRAAEEMRELVAELQKKDEWTDAARAEVADVIIVLSRVPGLWDAIQRKMVINKARTFRMRGDGTGYTVKGVQDAAAVPNAEGEDDYCIACWNCMPVGETCAVCGRVNTGER